MLTSNRQWKINATFLLFYRFLLTYIVLCTKVLLTFNPFCNEICTLIYTFTCMKENQQKEIIAGIFGETYFFLYKIKLHQVIFLKRRQFKIIIFLIYDTKYFIIYIKNCTFEKWMFIICETSNIKYYL